MSSGRISASSIFERSFDAISADAARFAVYFAVTTLVGIGIDQIESDAGSITLTLVSVALSIMIQTRVTETVLMMRDGAVPADVKRNRYIAVLGALIVSGFAIMLGLIILIIPGVFLFVRWYVLVPALLDGRNAQKSAYQTSYALTGREIGAVTLVAVVMGLPVIAIALGPFLEQFQTMMDWLGLMSDVESIGLSIAVNASISLLSVGSYYVATAMYLALNDDHHGLSDVFS